MNFTNLALRNALPPAQVYPGWVWEGRWSKKEKALVEAAIQPHVPAQVPPTFNGWNFKKERLGWFTWVYRAKRAIWQGSSFNAGSAKKLAEMLAEYYAGQD